MNKIEELIQQLCPEGVEWKMLGDISKINTGQKPVEIFEVRKSGIPYINAGLEPSGSVNTTNTTAQTITIPSRGQGGAGYVGYQLQDFWCGPLCYKIKSNKSYINTKFMFYYLKTIQDNIIGLRKIGSIPAVNKVDLEKISIPIPPLPIQQEIVSILDKFSQLEAELEAELEARRAQYNYYRNQLLSFEGKEVEWKTLGEVGRILRGTAITEKETISGEIPVVANSPNPVYFHNKSNRSGETIVIARSGAYAGLVSYYNIPFFLTDAFSVHPSNIFKTKFVYYFLKNEQEKIHLMKKGGGVPHVRANDFESYSIPIPPLSEQERIVGLLDKFDALVNDLSVGLPAEIAARRKQYEYYRGRLLDFKSLNN